MPVDLSRVNISLQQFQSISSGKYNAGEVKLESETELGKINHHVHLRGSNAKSISHAEVLAEATSGLFAPDEQMAVGMITSALPAAMEVVS